MRLQKQSLRIALLLILLIGEIALVFSLRFLGWNETGSAIQWISALMLAVLPLAAAVILLLRGRFRFSLRTLLLAIALVALFLAVTLMPLYDAFNSRRASRRLLAVGATLRTESSFDHIYKYWDYDPRPTFSSPAEGRQLAAWLRPLAGDVLAIPTDDAIKEVWLERDEQISLMCREASALGSLDRISVGGAVTPAGMEMLRQSLPRFTRLTDIHINMEVPKGWLRSLGQITTLSLWAERQRVGSRLSTDHLQEIAALSNLRVLWIFRYAVNDEDVQVLSRCRSLKLLVLRKTAVTEFGEQQLKAALPECIVHRD